MKGWKFCAVRRQELTPREKDVLFLLAHGSATKETAWSLGISVKTCETHIANIMMKLDIRNRYDLMLYLVKLGLHRELKFEPREVAFAPRLAKAS